MLKPIKKNIIVELIEKEKVTQSGIILKSADPAEVSRAKVLAIGDNVEYVEVGQTILPNWQKAKLTKFEDVDFYVVNEDDVVLIFEDEENA
jgi:co-chaperonin GroES (HSP10)